MSVEKSPLKKVTYLRSHSTERNQNIFLGGDSGWSSDLELLLEDEWRSLFRPNKIERVPELLVEHPPRICIVELGAYQGSEVKLFEAVLPKESEKLLIGHSIRDALSWRRTQRLLTSRGVKCLELSSDPKAAAGELSEVLIGLCAAGFSISDDLQLIQNAYQGFMAAQDEITESDFSTLFKRLASKFVFDPNDLVAVTLLVETYGLWKRHKDVNSSLFHAYSNAEQAIKDENLLKIIDFARKCFDEHKQSHDLSEVEFNRVLVESGFGRLTHRMLKGCYQEVRESLRELQSSVRIMRIA